jgi:acid phosphatase
LNARNVSEHHVHASRLHSQFLPSSEINTNIVMPSLITVTSIVIPVIALFIGLGLFRHSICDGLRTPNCPSKAETTHSGYFQYECAGKPHQSTWSSWWHPQGSDGVLAEHKQGAGITTNEWNILYHLGGNGPWVEKLIDVVDGGIAVPEGCHVEQVHMVNFARTC